MESDVSEVFLRTSDFAVEANYTFGNFNRNISVLFEENYESTDAFGNVQNTGPAAICAYAEILNDSDEEPDSSATLEIDGTTYHITSVKRSGQDCILILSEDAAALDA